MKCKCDWCGKNTVELIPNTLKVWCTECGATRKIKIVLKEHYDFLIDWAEMGIKRGDWAELPSNLLEMEAKLKEIEEAYEG